MKKNQRCHPGGLDDPIDLTEMDTKNGVQLSSIEYRNRWANRWLLCYLYTSRGRRIFSKQSKMASRHLSFFSFFFYPSRGVSCITYRNLHFRGISNSWIYKTKFFVIIRNQYCTYSLPLLVIHQMWTFSMISS